MNPGAILSPCGIYRYRLWRHWGEASRRPGPLCFIMLNPSTADADRDDPTIRRCIGFAKAWGFPGIRVENLFAFRSADPASLLTADDPVGPDADVHLDATFGLVRRRGGKLIVAWGAHPAAERRAAAIIEKAERVGVQLHCLGTTASGAPRHPLYVRSDQEAQLWR